MWRKSFLLLLHSLEAAVASQCWQGATFSEAVVSPAVDGGSILRVPGVASLPQCVAAGCDLPGYDLAWLFEGRCYVLSCQQRENCRPRERPGADSVLAFLRRASPQTLVLQSLVRGQPYGRWRPLSQSSEDPGDLEALKDLDLFDGTRRDFSDPGVPDVEYSEGNQEEKGGPGSAEMTTHQGPGGFNQSEAEDGPERGPTGSSVAQNRASSVGNISQGDEDRTRRPAGPAAAETTTQTQSSTEATSRLLLQTPTADSTQLDHVRTPSPAPPRWPVSPPEQPGTPADRPLMVSPGNPVKWTLPTTADASVSPEPTADLVKVFQSAAGAPQTTAMTSDPTSTTPSAPSTTPPTVTSDPTSTTSTTPPTVTSAAAAESEVGGSNCGPVAVVGPDRKLFLPVSSLSLDGGGSTDDRGIISYHWDAVSGPPGLKLEGVDQAVATATGFRVGRYTLRLTVSDQEGATGSASLTVRVQEARTLPPAARTLPPAARTLPPAARTLPPAARTLPPAARTLPPAARTLPPVAHASGSHTLALPNNSLVLRGSVTDGDQAEVHFLWVRDSQSPAAGDVLYASDTEASLYLANLVEGTYLFQLRVTDAQGRSCSSTATVEVRPEPGGGEEVELEMLVSVSQVSVAQRDTVLRQLAALIHVLDSDIQVRALQGHSHLSTVLRFSVQGSSGTMSGSRLVVLLRNQLLKEKNDYLLFRVLRVDTVLCLLRCSGRGQCDPITKECTCDPFWTENLIRRYFGDGESNCEWRVLYVILTSFLMVVFILSLSWTFICCCRRRRQTKVRKKTKYTILDNMDEQERMELRPKFSIKHRSTEHNSSLMMSESELDSDQDTIYSRDRPVRSRNRISAQAARNGNAFG